jgi:hypothetical protein
MRWDEVLRVNGIKREKRERLEEEGRPRLRNVKLINIRQEKKIGV